MKLLEKVLDHDDVELAGELTRFLGPFPQKSPTLSLSKRASQDSPRQSESGLVDAGITEHEVVCILYSSYNITFIKV